MMGEIQMLRQLKREPAYWLAAAPCAAWQLLQLLPYQQLAEQVDTVVKWDSMILHRKQQRIGPCWKLSLSPFICHYSSCTLQCVLGPMISLLLLLLPCVSVQTAM